MVGYVILLVLVMGIIFRIIMLHKQKKVSDEKTRFFINTAHDIRTPLTLIKAPLEEVLENRMGAEQAHLKTVVCVFTLPRKEIVGVLR